MDQYKVRLDIEPTDEYEKARKAFWKAFKAISNLSPEQKENLFREILNTEIGASLLAMLANMNIR